tara:strand:+ start:9760 stop:11289 length:1530 start_codon:yes stop_codon:yes gene_type:complete
VPDGDTGTNMALTVGSVLEELEGIDLNDRSAVCSAISHGSLMGARGNSGVILSQVLRGISGCLSDSADIDGAALATALTEASIAADGAVMKPVEGTILTVVRESARGAREIEEDATPIRVIENALAEGQIALERTPEQLQVLREAGVVDAGGAGFLLLLHGILHVLDGREVPTAPDHVELSLAGPAMSFDDESSELRYEVMYLLYVPDEAIEGFKKVWAGLGDSIVVVGGDGLWNCHIHTDDIGPAIEAGIEVGRPQQIRVTDLAEEVMEERWVREATAAGKSDGFPNPEPVPCGVVAVSPAPGISRIFHSLGVQELVVGGQTMNPSAAELLEAVERVPADQVVILPNNSNIVAVARTVDGQSAKRVVVVPTTSVPEGFASLLGYDPQSDAASNGESMAEIAKGVVVGEVTRAVRETTTSVGEVATGDWVGLDRSGVCSIADAPSSAATALLDVLVDRDHEILTVIVGEGVSDAETRAITEWIAENRPNIETEIHQGGQAHYPYLFGVE